MIIYILKFSGCLSLFMIFYKLFLEKESFHNLKRFYLLAALFSSICIPFITFTEYIEILEVGTSNVVTSEPVVFEDSLTETTWKDYLPNIIWSLYFIGLLVFSFRFFKHLYQLYFRIKNNVKLKNKKYTNVLLLDNINPHTFFKYIFLNKHKYESNAIPKEVLLHEQTHAKQLHALDIIIVELLQVVFWFNPLLYFIKKDIKLNHEFLADQSVLKVGTEPTNYQKLLLAFSSNACEPQLANAINYSSIKKRLTVMKTQTSKSRTWLKSLLLLPLLAVLVYGFSSEKVDYLYPESHDTFINSEIELYLNTQGELFYNSKKIEVTDLESIVLLENDITISIETSLQTDIKITEGISKSIRDYLRDKGLRGFGVCINATRDTQNNPVESVKEELQKAEALKINYVNNQKGASKEQLAIYNQMAKRYNKQPESSRIVKPKDLKQLETIYRVMTAKQKQDAEPFPNCPQAPDQDSASREQMKAYNSWAKKMNKQIELAIKTENSNSPKPYPIIRIKDVEKYKYIYSIMSEKQRKDSEPFPNLPEPPPPPPSPDVPSAPDAIDLKDVPPPPPPPKEPLDHVIDMAKKDAVFYLEGKKVSSDRAIEALKNNKSLNVRTKNVNTKQPEVYITKKPIVIKH